MHMHNYTSLVPRPSSPSSNFGCTKERKKQVVFLYNIVIAKGKVEEEGLHGNN